MTVAHLVSWDEITFTANLLIGTIVNREIDESSKHHRVNVDILVNFFGNEAIKWIMDEPLFHLSSKIH